MRDTISPVDGGIPGQPAPRGRGSQRWGEHRKQRAPVSGLLAAPGGTGTTFPEVVGERGPSVSRPAAARQPPEELVSLCAAAHRLGLRPCTLRGRLEHQRVVHYEKWRIELRQSRPPLIAIRRLEDLQS
jgi:hypothetical protein